MDTVLLLLFIYLVFNGVYKGFSGFILKSLGFVLGLYISLPAYKLLSVYLSKIFSGAFFLVDFLSFFTVFIFILSTFLLVEHILKKRLYRKKLIMVTDRVLGGFLGFTVFLLLLIFLVRLENHNIIVEKLLSDSKIVNIFKRI